MRKVNEKQKKRQKELKERSETIDNIVLAAIADPIQPLPLNLILEGRFNQVMLKGIDLEGEIAYLEEEKSKTTDSGEVARINGRIAVRRRKLDVIHGSIQELRTIGDLVKEYNFFGREFTVIDK